MTWEERQKRDRAIRQIEKAIRDEKSAAHEYSHLGYKLTQIKEFGLADKVRAIAADEARHHATLISILKVI